MLSLAASASYRRRYLPASGTSAEAGRGPWGRGRGRDHPRRWLAGRSWQGTIGACRMGAKPRVHPGN